MHHPPPHPWNHGPPAHPAGPPTGPAPSPYGRWPVAPAPPMAPCARWFLRPCAYALDLAAFIGVYMLYAFAANTVLAPPRDLPPGIYETVLLTALSTSSIGVFIVPLGLTGRTAGTLLCGYRILSHATGKPPGIAAATARGVAMSLMTGFWPLGILNLLWCLWDPRGQTLHDKIAGTVTTRT